MRVGLYLPFLTAGSREGVLAYARTAEDLGFDSLWTNSHTVVPVTFEPRYPYSEDGRPVWSAASPWPDAMTTLAFVAAVTERVRLGIAVVPLITTDPLTLAKQTATLDLLSAGRFELGVGGGWLTEEGRALGHPTDHRSARLEETIAILRAAWGAETFEHEGRFWRIPPVGINPRPPQGAALPLWIGGHGDTAVRIAAEHGAGLFIWLPKDPATVRGYAERLRARSATAPLATTLAIAQTRGRWGEAVGELRDAGADLVVVIRRYDEGAMDEIAAFAREVLPALS